MLDKIKGGIYGVAVGDALGATVEFMSRQEIKLRYGVHKEMIGGGWLALEAGQYTDDTQMTIDVALGILEDVENPKTPIGRRFVRWYETEPKDIGNTIKLAIKSYLQIGDWHKASQRTREQLKGRAGGNGCLMRTLPISFAYISNPFKMDAISEEIALMTHFDPEAALACIFYNRLAAKLVQAVAKEEAFNSVIMELEPRLRGLSKGDFWGLLQRINTLKLDDLTATGYVIDTLIAALVAFMQFNSFEEILLQVINMGDDADTVGAVAGGLAGTYYGFDAIPGVWIEPLHGKELLAQIAIELAKFA